MGRPADALRPRALRLFFALWPDEATRAGLAAWAQAIHRVSGGRMTPAANLHLTLAFIGSVRPEALPTIEGAAAAVAPPVFTLVIDTPGWWLHNRIAWAGARDTPLALRALVEALRGSLAGARIPFDPKPFAPHVTLVREARAGVPLPVLPPIPWAVRDFVLVESHTGPGGSRYAVRARWG